MKLFLRFCAKECVEKLHARSVQRDAIFLILYSVGVARHIQSHGRATLSCFIHFGSGAANSVVRSYSTFSTLFTANPAAPTLLVGEGLGVCVMCGDVL